MRLLFRQSISYHKNYLVLIDYSGSPRVRISQSVMLRATCASSVQLHVHIMSQRSRIEQKTRGVKYAW